MGCERNFADTAVNGLGIGAGLLDDFSNKKHINSIISSPQISIGSSKTSLPSHSKELKTMNGSKIRFPVPYSSILDPRAQEFRPTIQSSGHFAIVQPPIYYLYQYPSSVSPEFHSAGLPILPFYDVGYSLAIGQVRDMGSSSNGSGVVCREPFTSLQHNFSLIAPFSQNPVGLSGSGGRETASRTLLLSLVPPEISEGTLRRELEIWGPVRALQTERLQEGIATVHYFDLCHAQRALCEIQEQHIMQQSRLGQHYFLLQKQASQGDNYALALLPPAPPCGHMRGLIAGCAVWAQFAVPISSSVPDGYNQGTLVVFNLDSEFPPSKLKEIFEAFGPVKELRETPSKRQHRFVEFFDIRDAARALSEMNGQEINGKRVKIEFSRPGGQAKRLSNNTTLSPITHSPNNSGSNPCCRKPTNFYHEPPRNCNYQERFPWHHSDSPHHYLYANQKGIGRGNGAVRLSCRSKSSGDDNGGGGIDNDYFVRRKPRNNNAITRSPGDQQQQLAFRPFSGCCSGKNGQILNDAHFHFDEAKVESNCSDPRTTVMIKNIPNKYSQKLLLNMLDQHCISCNEQITDAIEPISAYDFVYLPIDFKNKCNVGYGFVNLTSPNATWKLYKAFHMQPWEAFNSRKICEVTYARLQGLDALKDHFKNSKFACDTDEYLPIVFSPPRDGKLLTEPVAIGGHTYKKSNYQQQQQKKFDDTSSDQPSSSSPSSPIDGDGDADTNHGNLLDTDSDDYSSSLPEICFATATATATATASLDSETQQPMPHSVTLM